MVKMVKVIYWFSFIFREFRRVFVFKSSEFRYIWVCGEIILVFLVYNLCLSRFLLRFCLVVWVVGWWLFFYGWFMI